MPIFVFRCPVCGLERDYLLMPGKTEEPHVCFHCAAEMEKQPTAPNFTVQGFNAKNGYTKA